MVTARTDRPAQGTAVDPATGQPDAYYPDAAGQAHPGPLEIALPAGLREAIVAHARRELPNEACGLIVGDRPAADGGRALRWVPTRNVLASPYRYEIDPGDLLRVTVESDDAGDTIWGIVHSHVASPARPSPTDLRQSFYPDLAARRAGGGASYRRSQPAGLADRRGRRPRGSDSMSWLRYRRPCACTGRASIAGS